MADLKGKKIAVLVSSGVQDVELTKPVEILRDRGAEVTVIVPTEEELKQGIKTLRGSVEKADASLSEVNAYDFDALYIPGGASPDHLRMAEGAVDFVKAFADRPIFALCHGPQLLVSAGLVKGRTITSWPSLEVDLENAGAHWVDQEVVQDGNIITSRKPDDIPAFTRRIEQYLTSVEVRRRKAA